MSKPFFQSSRDRCKRMQLALLRYVCACLLITVSVMRAHSTVSNVFEINAPEQSAIRRFKTFIASPPNIEHLIYCKFTAQDPVSGLPDMMDAASNNYFVAYHRVRYQPRCIF